MGQGFRINVYNNTAQTLLVQSGDPTGLAVYKSINQAVPPGEFLTQEPLYYEIDAGAGGLALNIFTPSGDAGFISLLLDESGNEAWLPGSPCIATFLPASTSRGTHIFPFMALGVWGDWALGTINLVEVVGSLVQRPQVSPERYGQLLPGF